MGGTAACHSWRAGEGQRRAVTGTRCSRCAQLIARPGDRRRRSRRGGVEAARGSSGRRGEGRIANERAATLRWAPHRGYLPERACSWAGLGRKYAWRCIGPKLQGKRATASAEQAVRHDRPGQFSCNLQHKKRFFLHCISDDICIFSLYLSPYCAEHFIMIFSIFVISGLAF